MVRSRANATSGAQQVGLVTVTVNGWDRDHAALWNGTAASFVDLNPAGAEVSIANAVFGAQQVGFAFVGNLNRAGMWNGSAASWVDLNPAGAGASSAQGTSGTHQVGGARFGNVWHAGIWSGSAGSWEDLSIVLPGSWGNTAAYSIWSDGSFIVVAGFGRNNATARDEALLWTRPMNNCPGDFNHDGFVNGNDYDEFADAFDAADPAADLNADGFVNGDDYDLFAEHFDAGC
ncbi:MAG: hypothetical protein JNL50_03460 [Phycisphaerae bacterium]|nr:hypothetical protein [Phycisphaerae bacterium]